MEPTFDPDLVVARRLRAARQEVPGGDFLMAHAAGELAERLSTLARSFEDAVTLFSGSDHAARALAGSGKVAAIRRVEADAGLLGGAEGLVAAPETVPPELENADLIVSLLALQDVNDLPGLLIQIRRALRPDGLFLAALAGGGTLRELRESLLAAEAELTGGASPRVHPFADVRDLGALLQRAGFALPVADLEPVTVRHDHMFALMADLRAMGATSALAERPRRPPGRALFARAAEIYAERHADPDGRIRATFDIVWLSGWAPHESQQKPARRGSATVSLAEALERKRPGG